MTKAAEKLCEMFEELVPMSGKADTEAGEIVRAVSRIGYRFTNDGDQLGIGYGRETCNPAGRYLGKKCNDAVAHQLTGMWEIFDSYTYERKLNGLYDLVLGYLEEHPELKQKENAEDFWDYRDPDEDVDDYEEEEDDYEEEDYYDDEEEEDW